MKKIFIAAVFMSGFGWAFAQNATKELDPMEDKDLMTWYHKSFSSTNTFGVNTEAAYQYLNSKGLKPTKVTVGVLDSGVEVDHPGLVKNIWTNTKEIPGNGIDDDKNGYIDDIHGWNFLGSKKGDVDVDNMEVTRIVKQYQSVFEGVDSKQNKANQVNMPKEFAMYMEAKQIFNEKSIENRRNYMFFEKVSTLVPTMVKILDGKDLTSETLRGFRPTTQDEAIAAEFLGRVLQDPEVGGKSAVKVEEYLNKLMKDALAQYGPAATKQYNLDFDPRAELVGDNYSDYSERFYGNNNYEGPDAQHGTHVAGIIAGYPQGKEVQYGVANKVANIMSVRVVPNGDERDKDVANAIRYAVDNGAKILNMSFGKPVSPGVEHVWDAVKYAESKRVLLIKAAGNENEDLAEHPAYPTNFKTKADESPFVNNMIVVGASTNDNGNLKADFSNFNRKMVTLFAPGDKIYSTVPDGKYEYLQGTSMASPVVAGAAAVLLSYMPTLTPAQIIESLVRTSNRSQISVPAGDKQNMKFDMLSQSGGVIDLERAAEYAYENFYKKSTPTKKVISTTKKSIR